MVEPGSKIIIINKPDSCCGVIAQGFECEVADVLYDWQTGYPDNILVLTNHALV